MSAVKLLRGLLNELAVSLNSTRLYLTIAEQVPACNLHAHNEVSHCQLGPRSQLSQKA